MKTVILAGGLGTRLIEETKLVPKPMIRIGDMPILWHIMKYFSCFGHKEFIICLGFKGNVIRDFFINYDLYMKDVTIELGKKIHSARSRNDQVVVALHLYLKVEIETIKKLTNSFFKLSHASLVLSSALANNGMKTKIQLMYILSLIHI